MKHPSEVLKVGDEVNVYVLSVNPTEKKIALSIKRTQPEPWSRVASKYEIGQVVPATITQLANFGAFARIEDGIEGLIHVSELSEDRVNHPREVVQEGQEVTVRIIRIDAQRRRMGLSLRRVNEGESPLAEFGEAAADSPSDASGECSCRRNGRCLFGRHGRDLAWRGDGRGGDARSDCRGRVASSTDESPPRHSAGWDRTKAGWRLPR